MRFPFWLIPIIVSTILIAITMNKREKEEEPKDKKNVYSTNNNRYIGTTYNSGINGISINGGLHFLAWNLRVEYLL